MRSPSGSAMERVEYDEHVFATLASPSDGCNRWALAGVAQTTEEPQRERLPPPRNGFAQS